MKCPKTLIFTIVELTRVNRRFSHTQLEKIFQLVRMADSHNTAARDLDRPEMITRRCDVCQRLAAAPNRFRVTFPNSNCTFNRFVCLDLMKIDSKLVLHAVDRNAKLSSTRLLLVETTMAIWETFTRMGANSYIGYPEIKAIDQGPHFTSSK